MAEYKNQRVARSNNNEHPLFLGPIFLHRDATFETYYTFLSTVKASLCKKSDIEKIEISTNHGTNKEMVFGSDEETALTSAIESVFPYSQNLILLLLKCQDL